MKNCPSGGEATIGVAGLGGPGRGVPVGELPPKWGRLALGGDGRPVVGAAGEQTAIGGVRAGGVLTRLKVGIQRQGQLADGAWGTGACGGAAARVGPAEGR